MRRRGVRGRRGLLLVVLAGMTAVVTACPPMLPTAIGPNVAFRGVVNGTGDGAVVQTVCPGPAVAGGTGHVVAGQLVAATRDPKGPGNTGDNGAVFIEAQGSAVVVPLAFWDVPVEFPTDIDVPCDGPGLVVFDPCFGIIGCRGAARAATVKVVYQNIAD